MFSLKKIKRCLLIVSLCLASTLAHAGNEDGGANRGGGNLSADNPADVQLLEKIVSERHLLELVFASLRTGAFFEALRTDSVLPENQASLVRFKSMIEQIRRFGSQIEQMNKLLSAVEIKIQADPCLGPDEQHRDANAKATKKKKYICLSSGRILPKVTATNASAKILALLAHEIAHLVGANETDAENLQAYVEAVLVKAGQTEIKYFLHKEAQMRREMQSKLDEVLTKLQKIDQTESGKLEYCNAVSEMRLNYFDVMLDLRSPKPKVIDIGVNSLGDLQSGIYVVVPTTSAQQEKIFDKVHLRVLQLEGICAGIFTDEIKEMYLRNDMRSETKEYFEILFQKKNDLTFKEVIKRAHEIYRTIFRTGRSERLPPGYYGDQFEDLDKVPGKVLRRINTFGDKAMVAEMQDATNELRIITKDYQDLEKRIFGNSAEK
jgi:hypothetical protein